MPKRMSYDEQPLLPNILAEVVCEEIYTGQEWSIQIRDYGRVAKTEAARLAMTPEQKREFSDLCDRKCRIAYDANAAWIVKIFKANNGPAQLANILRHWLDSYLNDPRLMRRDAGVI